MAATLTIVGNAYVYPREGSNSFGSISEAGLGAWTDITGSTRVYFWPQKTGSISVSIKARSVGNTNTLRLSLDGSASAAHDVVLPKSSDFQTYAVGTYTISSSGYHYLEIRAVTKNSTYLPDVQALVISGSAAEGLKYNKSSFRGAPSTHLWYKTEGIEGGITWFYSEIYVKQGEDPLHSYYMTNGFGGGYFGIQVNSPTERRVLFSIWSNYDTQKPEEIPEDYKVKLVKKGSDVISGEFGNEGSGAQSYFKYMWKTDTVYRCLVKAEASGSDNTIFSGYFYMPESGWKLIARWNKPKTGALLLTGLYSFVENFSSNGNDYFKAHFGNQWAYGKDGWVQLTKAGFTTTASEEKHQRYDYGAGAEGIWMYMYSGGFKQTNNVKPGDIIQRSAGPDVDLKKLDAL
ncbi:hypothetical protein SELMODRAFT_407289 [Selaginella moellendorffii]|uniref:DUF5077 domain-containing protein n=1 Tax=Selaginella moellendorffii TaxID=88036 RepID=D8R4J1_SELML|nr:uncharacterized protein LOC9634967 [Selaginella moellendorffii]EFJ33482.1 hypothetical protein SELMODRAFT_407289 [Selaginella moellendorffii]|eukprot:XP_002966062.1 uncharacterized protein LOC9634967 [Selaginella moellendorffii]